MHEVLAFTTDDTGARVRALRERREHGKIERRRDVTRNAPRLAGTRIPTAAIWSFKQAGYSAKDILSQYPTLTEDDVTAAIDFEQGQERKRKRAQQARRDSIQTERPNRALGAD